MKKLHTSLALSLLLCCSLIAQQAQIREHITNVFEGNCIRHAFDRDILNQDVLFSIKLIDSMVRLDTFYRCTKERVLPTSFSLLSFSDSSNYDETMAFLIRYLSDTSISNRVTLLNNFVSSIWHRHMRIFNRFDYSTSVVAKEFIGSPLFYESTSPRVPLLISYTQENNSEKINDLRNWGRSHDLSDLARENLTVALLRLEDSEIVDSFRKNIPETDREWDDYLRMLDFARNESAVSILASLLDNKDIIFSHQWDENIEYATIRSFALSILSTMIENFPVPFHRFPPTSGDKNNPEEHPEEYFESAKQFLREREFIINRRPPFSF